MITSFRKHSNTTRSIQHGIYPNQGTKSDCANYRPCWILTEKFWRVSFVTLWTTILQWMNLYTQINGCISPVFKKGTKSDCTNYRPLTMLTLNRKKFRGYCLRLSRQSSWNGCLKWTYTPKSMGLQEGSLYWIVALVSCWNMEKGNWHRL